MHLRAMLFRPIIMQKGLAEVLASRSDLTKAQADTLIKAKTLLCARACLNAALRLIALLWRTFDTQAPGDWWWDPHCRLAFFFYSLPSRLLDAVAVN